MNKIFKYQIKDGKVNMPETAIILRVDHVDDGFYLGDFVWAIVDTSHENAERVAPDMMSTHKLHNFDPYGLEEIQIAVKEKQQIQCGVPVYARDKDGKMFVYSDKSPKATVNIAVYKTGQEIDIPVNQLFYLGLNRLWIVQELGLYTFSYVQ